MSCHIFPLKNISENLRSKSHHIMPHHLFLLKIILKIQENQLMSCHLSPLKNNSYLYFYNTLQVINFNSLNIQVCHIILYHVIFLH
jgi:hypothetical protein